MHTGLFMRCHAIWKSCSHAINVLRKREKVSYPWYRKTVVTWDTYLRDSIRRRKLTLSFADHAVRFHVESRPLDHTKLTKNRR